MISIIRGEKDMKILVLGGTRFFGVHMIQVLVSNGHEVTVATRGLAEDPFGNKVSRIILERTDAQSMKLALETLHFDVVIDKIAYGSNDIRYVLDVIDCDKYILMSSTSVYDPKHWNTKEEDFEWEHKDLVWCSRNDFSYEETKRQAECALWQRYKGINAIAVRYPFTIGRDDYTKRIFFYVEHVMQGKPMNIDNVDCQMSFIRSDEAGKFIAFLVDQKFSGPINGCSNGTISIRQILDYVENRTGKKAMISSEGEEAPYNQEPEYSIVTKKAKNLGFEFTDLKDWIYDLLDYYIEISE